MHAKMEMVVNGNVKLMKHNQRSWVKFDKQKAIVVKRGGQSWQWYDHPEQTNYK